MNLSADQRKKIEENRAAALQKKQQFIHKTNSTLFSSNLTLSNNSKTKYVKNKIKPQPSNKEAENESSLYTPAVFSVVSEDRFIVDMPYHAPSIEVFKSIQGRMYDAAIKKWSFPLSEHFNLTSKLRALKPEVVVNAVPENVIQTLTAPSESEEVDWSRIDKTLRDSLLPFQVEGVRFGIKKKGRCLIADDMGLGKTIQSLGIACYFRQNWPLLIICPSSMRFPWQEAIKTFLPNINPTVSVLTCGKDIIFNEEVIITSYDLMKTCSDHIKKKKFGIVIFDESHALKNLKSARTQVALDLCKCINRVILLSGTPALSRPQELYSQIYALDTYTFPNFFDFGIRYCNGKKDKFGWNFTGFSNLEELEIYLRKKIMVRRLKSEVLTQLPEKNRKIVILQPNLVKSISKKMKEFESEYESQKGTEKQSTLLSYYSVTGNAKLKAVCEYIEDKLENSEKFLVFAHHVNVMNGICDLLEKKKVNFIRIDGSVSSESRQLMCNEFQNNANCRVAVLSLKAANTGITLTEAQLVIFAELFWNPGELIQAEDRAHRIGQRDSVLIEYLIAKGTADDIMWGLVESKLKILNKVGLSKDSFKNADTENLQKNNQPTILSMFLKEENTSDNKIEILDEEIIKELEKEMVDDDIFDNVNLEEIEIEYLMNSKKRKTSS